jgi:2-polyprenyl-3-methyl-5-hydroxy-6-metoxy-1,4-benzoquinol methylase
MIADNEFLQAELDMGINPFNPQFIALCNATVSEANKHATFETVLDFGCGVGAYSDAFHKAGYNVSAYDIFPSHQKYVKENLPHLTMVDKPLTTDLMLFIEVAEHMTDKEINAVFKKIKPKYILFSSTSESKPEWDEQWGHINIKQEPEWIELFQKKGYELISKLNYPTQWSLMLKQL